MNSFKLYISSILVFSLQTGIYAEYRVYQYYVKSKSPDGSGENTSKIISSSLNPTSFFSYHGERESIKIDLLRTWICPGYTGEKKEYCDSPYKTLYLDKKLKQQIEEGVKN